MRSLSSIHVVLGFILIISISPCFSAEQSTPKEGQESKYLQAVREFADNVLKYGRDTYGPKHTPLFVDGLNIHTHEPVKWISPKGDLSETTETEEWILSNLALQQNLFRVLDSLTAITSDPRYRQAAMDAIAYAFENLRTPNGLFYWGEVNAYDAGSDTEVFRRNYRDRCSFKAIYPHYQLMWEVDPNATEEFIETLWAAHILDWSNLDMDRIAPLDKLQVTKGWEHEYEGGPVYFKSKGMSFCTTGGDLCYAACMLSKLSGKNEPLIWGKRIAHRYVETRYPRTGFSDYAYTGERNAFPFAEDFEGHTIRPVMVDFGGGDPANRRLFLPIYMLSPGLIGNYACLQTVWYFLASELLGDEGNEFKQWALEELTARGKVAYRKEDNSWVPMLADGTKLEGYVCEKDMLGFARKGSVIKAWQVDLTDFWAYALGYRVTSDMFLWEMARNIVRGNSLGDIGAHPEGEALLDMSTDCHNAHALLGFLCLYERTQQQAFLDMAKKIGDNILAHKFYKGFFVASNKHIYARFDVVESLSLLHLFVAVHPDYPKPPSVWPSDPRFSANYRYKTPVYDVSLIYTLTDSDAPPISLGEAAAIGNANLAKSLIAEGADINNVETDDFVTPLHRAVENGNEEVVRLLLSEGANVHAIAAFEGRELTPFHIAVEKGYKGIIELLISKGADINAKDGQGRTPIDIAMRNARMDIASVLIDNGAEASLLTKMRVNMARQERRPVDLSLLTAAQNGEQQEVKVLLDQGADINAKDDQGMTPLHLAAQEGHKEVVEFLLSKDADINAQNIKGYTPLYSAIWNNDPNIVGLLVSKGADVNFSPEKGYPPLQHAVWFENTDIVRSLVEHGAKCDVKDKDGWTAFRYAADASNRDMINLFVSKGADVSGIYRAACVGDLDRVKNLIEQGVAVDANDELGWTPLFWAASMGQEEVGEFLLSKGARADVKTQDGSTPLHQASYSGALHLAGLLISKGAEVNAKNKQGNTPLHNAASGGHSQVAELLIAKGADVNAKAQNNWTPLHRAVLVGHNDTVALLIAHGADVSVKDRRGRTALDLAKQRGSAEIVEILTKAVQEQKAKEKEAEEKEIEKKEKPSEESLAKEVQEAETQQKAERSVGDQQELNRQLLGVVSSKGNTFVKTLYINNLLSKGADINAADEYGLTSLNYAVNQGNKDIVTLLIAKGAAVEGKDNAGRMPLHLAASLGDVDILNILITHSVRFDVNAQDNFGFTPLHYAAAKGHKEIVEALLKHNALVDIKDNTGRTSLHLVAGITSVLGRYTGSASIDPLTKGSVDMIKCLLDHGADINARENVQGWTPLHCAVRVYFYTPVVELLLERGADSTIMDNRGMLPLAMIARIVDIQRAHTELPERIIHYRRMADLFRLYINAYYVSPDGNDSNPGTIDNPFSSIQEAISVAGPGDTIFVRAGTYTL
ncbi:ankyrin repeat domain-containing protein, partial [Planctomycetota bacterium]